MLITQPVRRNTAPDHNPRPRRRTDRFRLRRIHDRLDVLLNPPVRRTAGGKRILQRHNQHVQRIKLRILRQRRIEFGHHNQVLARPRRRKRHRNARRSGRGSRHRGRPFFLPGSSPGSSPLRGTGGQRRRRGLRLAHAPTPPIRPGRQPPPPQAAGSPLPARGRQAPPASRRGPAPAAAASPAAAACFSHAGKAAATCWMAATSGRWAAAHATSSSSLPWRSAHWIQLGHYLVQRAVAGHSVEVRFLSWTTREAVELFAAEGAHQGSVQLVGINPRAVG